MMVCTLTGFLLLYSNKWETMSSLKIPKGLSETVNQKTGNTMTRRKRTKRQWSTLYTEN